MKNTGNQSSLYKKTYDQEGRLHSINDEPAHIQYDATGKELYRVYYQHGVIHRRVQPAIIRCDGSKEWFLKGQRHGHPAVAYANGLKENYEYGVPVSPRLVYIHEMSGEPYDGLAWEIKMPFSGDFYLESLDGSVIFPKSCKYTYQTV